ncbi:gamma-glutamylcyclotransferase family protein [Bacillus sp. Marseille-P3661]|uniref:gamma-glutamylcyclotransferase family protein n=1 Tax=Bacillus sp. Marseille-P3661 TaxID=1936234 RepID=UPI000C849FCC|nr:gamma-glutamylcyclotransferase family protein [Bacillus sp. Marseille-P3661]
MANYFAYGSCMSLKDIRRTVGTAQYVGPATLQNYRLGFTKFSKGRQGGVADIVPAAGEKVEGIVFSVPDFIALDRREGVHIQAYKRISLKIELQTTGEEVETETYTVVHKEKEEIIPSEEYMNIILDGACNLSEHYQNMLKERFDKFKKRK